MECNDLVDIDCPSTTPRVVSSVLHAWYELNGSWIQNATVSGGQLWRDRATPALHEAEVQCKAEVMFKNGSRGRLDSSIYVISVQGTEFLNSR